MFILSPLDPCSSIVDLVYKGTKSSEGISHILWIGCVYMLTMYVKKSAIVTKLEHALDKVGRVDRAHIA